VTSDAMRIAATIAVALILTGCSGDTPPARRAAKSDSTSARPADRPESLQDSTYAEMAALWLDHRVKRSEISGVEDYARGFLKGYEGPPGLVDGSPDFNLGHSDGMRARMGLCPNELDEDGRGS
jgi:hypothetical protein